MLVFLTSGCLPCRGFWEAFTVGVEAELEPLGTRLVIVTQGPDRESEATIRSLMPRSTPTVMSASAWSDYAVPGSPYVILIDGASDAIVGEGSATTWPQVVNLMRNAVADGAIAASRRRDPSRRQLLSGRLREQRADRELLGAGIEPGHPSLYPDQESGPEGPHG